MDPTVKSEFMESVKRQITRDCALSCFIKNSPDCTETCYDSYLNTLNITAKTLRNLGYSRNSRYVTLAYGEKYDEWERVSRFNDDPPDELGFAIPYLEKNVFNENKDI